MLHKFTMTSAVREERVGRQLRSGITTFIAETGSEPSAQLGIPERITGRLESSLTPAQLFQFGFKPDVEVGFEGRAYRFSRLEKDGTFELSIIAPVPGSIP